MTVDLEAIARRTNCELTSLKSALPLIEQGYAPPFLARYRRDELGGLGEHAMWTLFRAMREEAWIKNRREDLIQRLEQMPQADPAIGKAVRSANSKRVLDRLARRTRSESSEASSPSKRVAARILSPEKGDPGDVAGIMALLGITDDPATVEVSLDAALVSRLAMHPQIQGAAVRWLFSNAKIRILSVNDSHLDSGGANEPADSDESGPAPAKAESLESPIVPSPAAPSNDAAESVAAAGHSDAANELAANELAGSEVEGSEVEGAADESPTQESQQSGTDEDEAGTEEAASDDSESTWPTPEELTASIAAFPAIDAATSVELAADGSTTASASDGNTSATGTIPAKSSAGKGRQKKKPKPAAKVKELKTVKKISPRQRRRRWLVSVLQPLAGKEILAQKLTAFQTLMIGRGLRSGVVQCQFVYDTNKLTDQIQRTAGGLNEAFGPRLRELVSVNDATIREAAEAAWWDELLESSATRLVNVAADHLDSQINRGGVEAKIVMAIDAMGPRTSAVAIVAADGRLIHTEDIPCQLTTALRSAAVTRVGELIHQYGVDLIVISNGPSRRACLVILHELVEQSTPGTVRWTIAERSGADVYAGSELGNREMRSTPRRFRSAAWLAFAVLRPSQAVTKVDPIRLRLGSFQRELAEDALWPALRDVMTSGVSRGGVDVNSAPVDWLCQLPGLNREIATAIDKRRREKLFASRSEVLELEQWPHAASARQAIPFLRVFGSDETLDGTLVHPDDYALAKKLATALKLELPPATPPGYQPPHFDEPVPMPSSEPMALESKVEEINAGSVLTENFAANIQPVAEEDAVAESAESAEQNAAPVSEASESEAVEEPVGMVTPAEPDASAEPGSPESKTEVAVESVAAFRQPFPDSALISKCIKEWQVGARRVRNIVDALCNPFGDEEGASNGAAHAVMTKVPKLVDLKNGDQVIGVVVGVTEFGAFIEMSPECSGLIHVSRVADRYVEDLHEAVQVGDVITAWVTNVDAKRRRIGLSAISPERELEIERQRNERREESYHRGQQGSRPPRGGQNRGDAGRGASGPRAEGNRGGRPEAAAVGQGGNTPRGDSRGRGDARGGHGDSRPQGQGSSGQGSSGQGRGDSGRGDSGRGGAGRGGSGRGGQRGGRRDDRDEGPSSYNTKVTRSDTPATPISEAMAKGDEPLRSFGDLMQFFKKAQPEPVITPKSIEPKAIEPKAIEPKAIEAKADIQGETLEPQGIRSEVAEPIAENKPASEEGAPTEL